MASFSTVTAGQSTVEANHINQFADALGGNGNYPISLTGINDAVNWALSVRNQEAGSGRTARLLDSSGTARLTVDGNGPRVDVTGAGTLTPITPNAMTTQGDVLYGGSTALGVATPTRLAIGSSGFVLESTGGIPAWRNRVSGFSVYAPAGAFELSPASFPQIDRFTSTNWTRRVLRFSPSLEEFADVTLSLPSDASVTTIKGYIHWTQSTGSSADVTWRIAHLSRAGAELLDTAPASTVSVTSSGSSVAGTLQMSSVSFGTSSGYAAGEQVDLRLTRSTGGLAHDAYLIGVRLESR